MNKKILLIVAVVAVLALGVRYCATHDCSLAFNNGYCEPTDGK